MADIRQAFGTASTFTCTLASLANGSARQTNRIDNSSDKFLDALIGGKVKTHTTGVSAAGSVSIYAFGSSDDGTTQTENAGASDAAITLSSPPNAKLVGTINANVNNTTYNFGPFSVAAAFGGVLPKYWGLIFVNNTGAILSATEGDHAKQYQGVYATAA